MCRKRKIKVCTLTLVTLVSHISRIDNFRTYNNANQCDERPGECSYCIKTKQICPGYRDTFDLAWRDQTNTAKNSVERRRKAAAKQDAVKKSSSPHSKHLIVSRVPSASTDVFALNVVPTSLMQKTEDYAIGFYFTSYGRVPASRSEKLCGFQDLILPLFISAKEDSALKMSTMALATLFFNTWTAPQPENPLSRSYYVKALAAIKQQLKENDYSTNDEMIMSVLLLQLFEVRSSLASRISHSQQLEARRPTAKVSAYYF